MITTNLTLTNGPTSDVPMEVVGVTFEVDTKLTINPAAVFPFTVAIDSSEVVGIDFDETLYTGDHTESITINTRNPRYNIVHTVSIDDTSVAPTAVTDLEATDDEIGQITITFTNATGTPAPTYNLMEDGIEVATGIVSGHVRIVVAGDYEYSVVSVNVAGSEESSVTEGKSLPPLSLPVAITDFDASDDEYEQVTITFTPAVGNPVPTQDLYEDDISIVTGVASGYTHDVSAGTRTYKVVSTNSEGDVDSNEDDGISLVALSPPSAINDFVATGDVGFMTATWTDATGNPIPTYELYEDDVLFQAVAVKDTAYATTAGIHSYYVKATNSESSVDSNTNAALVSEAPSAILDFEATDDEEGQIVMTFTPATGVPTPRHNLFEGGVEIAQNIPDGYIHIIEDATNTYRVDAINIADTIPSNDDSGTSLVGAPPLTAPSEILDFEASDSDELTITMNFTNSTGNPAPTHALIEDDVAVVGAENITDGYVHTPSVVGTYTYRIDAINSEGTQPSNDNDGTCTPDYTLPTVINDFLATDGVGEVVMSFTDSVGNPTPTHALYEDNIQIIADIDTGYVHTVSEGTYTYRVDAINTQGVVSSNDDDGTSEPDVPPVGEEWENESSEIWTDESANSWTTE